MASKLYYHDIDLAEVGQLLNARLQNVSTTERNALTLGSSNAGMQVWDTTVGAPYVWDGSSWVRDALVVTGDVVFQGTIDASTSLDAQATAAAGNQYVVTTAGTLSMTSVTFTPSATAEVGDVVLFTSTTTATVMQRNTEAATESALGIVELATQTEVNTGTDTTRVITPATLANSTLASTVSSNTTAITDNDSDILSLQTFTGEGTSLTTTATTLAGAINEHETLINTNATDIDNLETFAGSGTTLDTTATSLAAAINEIHGEINTNATNISLLDSDVTVLQSQVSSLQGASSLSTYFNGNVSLSANTAATITHNLGLTDANSFIIRVADTNGSDVSVDVDAVNTNSLTLTSLVALTGLKVTILGF